MSIHHALIHIRYPFSANLFQVILRTFCIFWYIAGGKLESRVVYPLYDHDLVLWVRGFHPPRVVSWVRGFYPTEVTVVGSGFSPPRAVSWVRRFHPPAGDVVGPGFSPPEGVYG